MLQRGQQLARVRAPQQREAVRGAAEQVPAAGAEAAAVNPVAVRRQRGERQLREAGGGAVDAEALVSGARRQQGRGERAAPDLVRVVPQGVEERHHDEAQTHCLKCTVYFLPS